MRPPLTARALVGSCHPGPTLAVTLISALLARPLGHSLGTGALVTGAVFAGQLTIGWSNDLIDLERDRASGRRDKPLAAGLLAPRVVRLAIAVAGLACLGLSLAGGWVSALLHLTAVVGSGWAYNLGLKRTTASWIPYAVAFGALPAVVALAAPARAWPPMWMMATGALLGVGAHLLNAVPDLADDAATDVRALPHALGERGARIGAVAMLLAGTGLAAVATRRFALVLVAAVIAAVALRGRGQRPFYAAAALAVLTVAALAWP